MKRSSYMIGIAVIMLAAAFAVPGLFAEDADATVVPDNAKDTAIVGEGDSFSIVVDSLTISVTITKDAEPPFSATTYTGSASAKTLTVYVNEDEVSPSIVGVPEYVSWTTGGADKVKFTFGDVAIDNVRHAGWTVTDESATAVLIENIGVTYQFNDVNTIKNQTDLDDNDSDEKHKIILMAFEDAFPGVDKSYFQGWLIGGATYTEGSEVAFEDDAPVVKAKFLSYEVLFEASAAEEDAGAVTVPTMDDVTPNTKITLPGVKNTEGTTPVFNMTVTDRQFIGWYVAGDETKTLIAPGTEYIVTKNVKFIAVYNGGFEVTFDVGETSTKTTSIRATAEGFVAPVPAKEGYTFGGWYAGETFAYDAEGALVDGFKFTADTVLTAKFIANNMTVTFVVGDFSSKQTVLYGECAMAPALPEGYVAWLGADGEEFDFSTPITADVTITAKEYVAPEVPVYKLTFVVDTTNVAETTTADMKIPADPAKTGYEFMGWAVDGVIVDFETYEITADTTFTAQFKELIFTVKFLNKDGTEFQAAQTVKYGQTVTMPASSFIGWQTKTVTPVDAVLDEDGNVVTEATEVITYTDYNFATPVTGDLVLYGEEAVVEPGFFETATGKCVIILAFFALGLLVYKAAEAGKFDAIKAKVKAKGGKKE